MLGFQHNLMLQAWFEYKSSLRRGLVQCPARMATSRTSPTKYRYTPLKDNEIRIIYLDTGEETAPLSLTLVHVSLENPPEYEALSYCWGSSEQDKQVECRDQSSDGILRITNSLERAIISLRSSSRRLWIDQICINQEDYSERAQQVKLMGAIYTKTTRVVVWLGEADEQTEIAFRLLHETGDRLWQQIQKLGPERGAFKPENPHSVHYPLELTSADDPEWVALRRLFRRPWFSRVWTFQEAVLARNGVFHCGANTVGMSLFFAVVEAVVALDRQGPGNKAHLKGEEEIFQAIFMCNQIKTRFATRSDILDFAGFRVNIDNLARDMMARNTSEPHDKIYGMLGIVGDVNPVTFPVEYRIPYRMLYAYFTKFVIQHYHDLSILAIARMLPSEHPGTRPYNGPLCVPSWIPDYRFEDSATSNPRLHHLGPKLFLHGSERHYLATGLSKAFVRVDDSLTLQAAGIKVGAIDQLSDRSGNSQGETSIGPNVLNNGQWLRMARGTAQDGNYPGTGEPIDLAYARLRTWDNLPGELNRKKRVRERQQLVHIEEPGPSSMHKTPNGERVLVTPEGDKITGMILYGTKKQRFFITNDNYIGLAHESCMVGDEIWLLMGADKPMVLRRLVHGTYEFRGEAYVHGIMDGEYLVRKFKHADLKGCHLDEQTWLNSLSEGVPFETTEVILS